MAYTKEQVIELCKKVHGDKYDYSITEGVQNVLGKINYICHVHGVVEQALSNHLQGKGCRYCAKKTRGAYLKFTNEKFIEKSKKTHDDIDEYDFSELNVDDRDEKRKIKIICKKHGEFRINPMYFVSGGGCPLCHGKTVRTDEEVREELSKLHPELDFTQTKYSEKDSKYRIKVICPKHGEQLISYYNLKNGQGCYWCGRERTGFKNTITNEEFIERGKEIFGDEYTYERLDMKNRDEQGKVIVTCKTHGDFKITPDNFYHGHGCPKCQESKLERDIRLLLEENGIKYVYECDRNYFGWLDKQSLDFYLPEYNVAIECQGIQHSKPVDIFGGEEGFAKIINLDMKKRGLCKENNVKLLYYTDEKYSFPYKVFMKKERLLEEIKRR